MRACADSSARRRAVGNRRARRARPSPMFPSRCPRASGSRPASSTAPCSRTPRAARCTAGRSRPCATAYRRRQGRIQLHRHASTESAGLMSPYPGGLLLPELEQRPSCQQMWPPAFAPERQAVGKWTVLQRRDGRRQWAYDGAALYTSVLDTRPGDVLGGDSYRGEATRRPCASRSAEAGHAARFRGDHHAARPPAAHRARIFGLRLRSGHASRSACDAPAKRSLSRCRRRPPRARMATGPSSRARAASGSGCSAASRCTDTPRNPACAASRQRCAGLAQRLHAGGRAAARGFTVQDTSAGQVLADARGRTVYSYNCGDDAPDQLGCDHPDDTQVYRLAMCGGGSAERCARNFPYVEAASDARSHGRRGPSWRSIPRPVMPRRANRVRCASGPFASAGLRLRRRRATGRSQRRRAGRIPGGARRIPRFLVARRFLRTEPNDEPLPTCSRRVHCWDGRRRRRQLRRRGTPSPTWSPISRGPCSRRRR